MHKSDILYQHSNLRLQIELVPNSCWFSNVRSNVATKQWDTIRNQVYKKAGNACEICGGKGIKHPVECHEVWEYDEDTHIQKLIKFQALCPPCHEVKHYGLAYVRGFEIRAFKRFVTINKIDREFAREMVDEVYKQWEYRSTITWDLCIDLLQEYGINTDTIKNNHSK